MSHTNSTTKYNLPQFLPTDKPAWLTDINSAFATIDTAVNTAQTKADDAYTNAGLAQSDATTAINNAAAADAKGAGAIASIEAAFDPTTIYAVGAKVMYNSLLYRCIVAVVTPGPWTGSDNWERITVDSLIATTDSKIGSLTSLATTDKTSLVNAVNEVNGKFTIIDASSAISLNANITDVTKYLYKSGNVCNLEIRGKLTATSANTIATFNNSAYYPKCSRVVTAYLDSDNPSANPNGAVWLYDNGNIVYFGNSVSSKNVIISATYICKG